MPVFQPVINVLTVRLSFWVGIVLGIALGRMFSLVWCAYASAMVIIFFAILTYIEHKALALTAQNAKNGKDAV
jgi:cytochrome bd-type quinol oxidase subunit 1